VVLVKGGHTLAAVTAAAPEVSYHHLDGASPARGDGVRFRKGCGGSTRHHPSQP
jgi:hypothetical protein